MKYRNIQVAKMTGTKILAGLLVFGLTFSAPATAWAAEGSLTEVTSNESENGEKLQAKSIDGRDTLTEVSDLVLEMIHNEEIRYNEETGYLEDTGFTLRIRIRLLAPSPSGKEKRTTSFISPPRIAAAFFP